MQTAVTPITVNDAESKSADIVSENIDRLRRLFPELITEGENGTSVNVDVLKQLVGDKTVTDADEKYGLNWHGKRQARRLALTPSTGTLRPAPEESVDWDTTQNLMIEGDNLEVLKLLQKSYAGRVKLIYIDPPYNTGGDFVYMDDFRQPIRRYKEVTGQIDGGATVTSNSESSGRFHTSWLNMMYPRLVLARNLLREDGAIFISIDDHEVQNLRCILDEVFGPENFVATVIWQKVYAPKNSARHFSEDHDYILVYARSSVDWIPEPLPRTEEQNSHYSNPDHDPRGPWRADGMSARNYYSKGTYSIVTPGGRVIDGPPSGRYWVYSEEKFKELNADRRIWWGEEGNNQPAVKRFLSEVSSGRVPQTLWKYDDVGHTQEAKKDLLKRVQFASSDSVFDTPKPPRLIQQVVRIGSRATEGEIILDFFAGSGTTAEAVMQLNHESGGNRRYILVQLPEPTGAEDYPTVSKLTTERIQSAARAIPVETDNAASGQQVDLGFRVYKLDESNLRTWDPKPDDLGGTLYDHIEHIKPDRTEKDVLYELLLKLGLDLCVPIETRQMAGKTVYSVGAGVLFVSLPESLSRDEAETVATGIASWREELGTEGDATVVIRDSAFADDVAKANLAAILEQRGIKTVLSL